MRPSKALRAGLGVKLAVRRRRKSRKMRGSRTCGWGRVGQHRKSGSRGGFGRAGLHKHKWSWVVKYEPDALGKRGFARPNAPSDKALRGLNVRALGELAEGLFKEGKVEAGRVVVDLESLGYSKVLGAGRLDRPLLVRARSFTEAAVKKIREAGGDIEVVKP